MVDRVPRLRLCSGHDMPQLGLGTYNSMRPNEVGEAVRVAILMGYRHIDTAFLYQTEAEIGETIQKMIDNKEIKREELFITTKLWDDSHEAHKVEGACRKSLQALGMDYIDLYLIHFPIAFEDYDRKNVTMTDYLETWKAMEELVEKGHVRSIGVSNFNKEQVGRILSMEGLRHKPANLQVEITPYLANDDLFQYCRKHEVSVTGYAPFGAPGQAYIPKDAPKFFEEPVIIAIGNKYGKSPAQVILRWGIQRGYAIVPKSTSPARLKQNIDIFDFELGQDDMKAMMALDRGYRINKDQLEPWKDHPFYPFEK